MVQKFEVQHIIHSKGNKPYILVRQLTPGQEFSLTSKSYLKGIQIKPFFTCPRATNKNGEPRFDLFIFYPSNADYITQFEKNMIVELVTDELAKT